MVLMMLVVVGCSGSSKEEEEEVVVEQEVAEDKEEVPESEGNENSPEPEEEPEEEPVEEREFDTSMYVYADEIDVTDNIEINDQIALIIDMPEHSIMGFTFQHVLSHTYDFLQQDTAKEAKTIEISILEEGNQIVVLTVHPDQLKEFKGNDDTTKDRLVLETSIINMALPEIVEHAEIMYLDLIME